MPPKHQIGVYQREKLTVFISLREAPADVIVNLAHSADRSGSLAAWRSGRTAE